MNRRIFVLLIIGLLFVGSVAGAMVSTYISQIDTHKDHEKNRLATLYDQKVQDGKNSAHVNLQSHTDAEKQRISDEMDAYVQQAAQEAIDSYEYDGKAEITQAADDAIADLKSYVDGLNDE